MTNAPMRSILTNSGLSGRTLEATIIRTLRKSPPRALGIAVAYVSIYGARFLRTLVTDLKISDVRLIADIGDAITHPEALRLALVHGWAVRGANPKAGTFHSKIMVGGSGFSETAGVNLPTWMIVGSGNLSKGGLVSNVETGLIRSAEELPESAGSTFKELWDVGSNLNSKLLNDYSKYFAENNRSRSPKDLAILGVADYPLLDPEKEGIGGRKAPTPEERSVANEAANAAWAGLESFTGEYTLQVEFPRDAGDVLTRMVGTTGAKQFVDLACEDDQVRQMRFRYYHDNSMFRLNVPNDVPLVQWARSNKAGIALIEQDDDEGQMSFRIVPPGRAMNDVVGRSAALGTWGRTPTRLYGWY